MNVKPLSEAVGALVTPNGESDIRSLDRGTVIDLFKDSGAVLFRGFDTAVQAFEEFTNEYSDDYMDNAGSGSYRKTINTEGDGTIQSVSYSLGTNSQRTFGLPLHADRSYTKSQPPLMWFYCVRPAQHEGRTLVCDGAALYQALSDRTKALFDKHRIKYVRHYSEEHWQVLYHTDDLETVRRICAENDLSLTVSDDRSIHTEYVKPAVVESKWRNHKVFVNSILIVQWQEDDLNRDVSVVRLDDGSRIPDDVLAEIKQVSERLTYSVDWRPTDLMMVDNTRLMHGREAFDDANREIYVRMCSSVPW